ncbi:MAG TPA: SDR family oxidoreductase [Vineibacter sp.]|nr:SDR family oxidoreductase [Vineibacter sp.]
MSRLAGKTALIAGGGGGIGGAGAALLAREGAQVVCADMNERAAGACADEINAQGGRAVALALDVGDPDSVERAFARTMDALGHLDVLVYSVGTTTTANVLDLSRAEWDRVLGTNLTAAFALGQAAARQMVNQKSGGSIIFVTSQLAHAAIRNKTAYLASKGGLRSLTMGMALDLAPHDIRVNAVAPGPVMTGLTEQRFADADIRAWTLARIPAGRLGQPADIAGAIAFLASDESRWMTGTTIVVDGGYLIE